MIPAEAVEAAAKVLADCIGTGANNWEWHVDDARALLEAAAPHMRAQALEDAAFDFRHWSHVFETLRARAADERGGE